MKKTVLTNLGLSTKEADVYLALLRQGRSTPAKLAVTTKLNRATTYHLCRSLIGRGFVSEDLGGKTLHVVPTPPSDLARLLKKEEEQFKSKQQMLEAMIAQVSLLNSEKAYPVPKIQFVEEHKLLDHLYASSERWNKSASAYDHTWWGFQDHTFAEEYLEWIKWIWKHADKQSSVKLLSNPSAIETTIKNKFKQREIKFFPTNANFTATTWIVGDYVIMISTRHHPHYLVEIHDQTLAENLRKVFGTMWNGVK